MTAVIYYPGYSQQQVKDNLIIRVIASITNANPAVVTTTENHEYVTGMNVRFQIPSSFGMNQLNAANAQVEVIDPISFSINVNTSNMNSFAYPSPLPNAFDNPVVIPNNSGIPVPPDPLPYGNQSSFEGAIVNQGLP